MEVRKYALDTSPDATLADAFFAEQKFEALPQDHHTKRRLKTCEAKQTVRALVVTQDRSEC